MTDARAIQVGLEALTAGTTSANAAQVGLEALTSPITVDARVAQIGFEVLVRSFEPVPHQGWGIPA